MAPPGDLLAATAELVAIPSVSHGEAAIAEVVEKALTPCPWLRVERVGDNLVARTEGDPRASAEPIEKAIWTLDPDLPIAEVQSMEQVVSRAVWQPRFSTTLLGGFAALALALAAIGIYGVTAYSVQRRTGEIGIRMALGASRARIVREVLLQSVLSSGIGLLAGIPLAYAAGRLLSDRLYGVGSFDLPVVMVAVLLLSLSAVAAALVPARRAASIEPMQALRSE